MMTRCMAAISLALLPWTVSGQVPSAFEVLTERYVDRPVAMHRGQLQFNSGYDFSVINRKYDPEGESIDLTTDGSASSRHRFPFDIRYGILEFLQVSASTNYASMGIRSQNRVTVTGVGNISIKELQVYRGMDDLYLGLDLSNPLRMDFLDIALRAGIFLPLFDHNPDQPSHRVEITEPYPDAMEIEYRYNNKTGLGVPVVSFGGTLKIRSSRFSLSARLGYSSGTKTGESISWESRLSEGEISYRQAPYEYSVGNTLDYGGILAWQAIDWFAVLLSFEGSRNTGAWSTETGLKVLDGTKAIHSAGIGYDIQVAPSLRLSQRLLLPYTGQNILASRVFQTGISLNFMTGGRR